MIRVLAGFQFSENNRQQAASGNTQMLILLLLGQEDCWYWLLVVKLHALSASLSLLSVLSLPVEDSKIL